MWSVWIQLPKGITAPNPLVNHFDNSSDAFDAADLLVKNGNVVIVNGPDYQNTFGE